MTENKQNRPRLVPLPGEEDFETLREQGIYYVDKTQYLKPLFSGRAGRFLLLRPRRFGKTLTMSTLRCFLEMDYRHPGDTSRQQELFRGLKVMEDREFCEQHMGRYPVVSLSLKDTDGINFRNACYLLGDIIWRLALRFSWLKDSRTLRSEEKQAFSRLLDKDVLCSGTDDAIDTLQSSLVTICSALFQNCGRKPVLLIDEYDVPLQKASMKGYYEPMSGLIGAMLSKALKTNADISKGILTGCLRATKEGIFTGLNNLSIDTVLTRRSSICTAIGFTPAEVRAMFDYYGLGRFYEKARAWYDGYSIGGQDLFCPWDVMSYVEALCDDADPDTLDPESYWNNSSNTPVIREHMPHLTSDDAERMEVLLAGGNIEAEVDEGMSYGTFRYNISDYYKGNGSGEYVTLARKLIDQILAGDAVNAAKSLRALLRGFVSIRDNATRAPHENFYHGFLNGILAAAGDNISGFKSQAEAGSGYADIIFSSYDESSSVVIEVKYASDEKAGLQDLASRAIAQIEDKGYAAGLFGDGADRVIECGIAFRGRSCAVRCKELRP